MARDNVDVIESAWEAFGKGNLEAAVALAGEEAELRIPETLPFGGVYRGPDGFRDYVDQLLASFGDFRATPEKVLGADDDHVVVVARTSGRTRGGDRFEGRSVWIYKLRDGRVVEAEAFIDTARMLELLAGDG
jgi:ketosteroid isomerase-like protein